MGLIDATQHHAEAMAQIHAVSFPAGEQWTREAIGVQLGLHGGFGLIDEAGGFVLARAVADEAEILTIAVLPELRGQGKGGALLEEAARRAAGAGAVAMFLEVAVGNVPARHLYDKCGFTEIGRRRGYYAGGADALVMRRVLMPPGAASDG